MEITVIFLSTEKFPQHLEYLGIYISKNKIITMDLNYYLRYCHF